MVREGVWGGVMRMDQGRRGAGNRKGTGRERSRGIGGEVEKGEEVGREQGNFLDG